MAISGKMLDTYVHDANAIIYIYDITDVESFTSIDFWNREVSLVSKSQPSEKDAPIKILLANKNDLAHLSKIDNEKHKTFALNHKMEGYQGSAKTGD